MIPAGFAYGTLVPSVFVSLTFWTDLLQSRLKVNPAGVFKLSHQNQKGIQTSPLCCSKLCLAKSGKQSRDGFNKPNLYPKLNDNVHPCFYRLE